MHQKVAEEEDFYTVGTSRHNPSSHRAKLAKVKRDPFYPDLAMEDPLGLNITAETAGERDAAYRVKTREARLPPRKDKEKKSVSLPDEPFAETHPSFHPGTFLRTVEGSAPASSAPLKKQLSEKEKAAQQAEISELVRLQRIYLNYTSHPKLAPLLGKKPPKPKQETVLEYRCALGHIRSTLNAQGTQGVIRTIYPQMVGFAITMFKYTGLEQTLGLNLPAPDRVVAALTQAIAEGELDTEILEAECELQDLFASPWYARGLWKTVFIIQCMSEMQNARERVATDAMRRRAEAMQRASTAAAAAAQAEQKQ